MAGRTISHYKITEKLGEGGMGVVYKAEDTKLDRTVALKFLAGHLLNDEEAKARFLREAKAAAGLHHPNICPVYEISEAEGRTFLSMAFIEGEPLEARIERGPLALKEALEIGRQIAEGLEAAHEKGVVHRDIKPANVMVDAKGRATIMDFGLAHLTEASRLTKTDQTMGTVAYMSPEQAQGMEVDNRSDVWALGVVLYEMVRGQRPFQGQYDQALLYEIVHQVPEPLTGVRAGVPMELEFIVGKCLAKDSDDRPSSAEEIARDLRTLGEKLKSGRSTVLHTGIVTGPPAGSTQPPGQAESPSLPGPLAKYRVIEDEQETGDSIRYVAEDTELHRSVAIRVLPQSEEQRVEITQRRRQNVLLGTTVLAVVLAVVFGLVLLFSPAAESETKVVRFSIFAENLEAGPRISPDGKHVSYTAEANWESALWLRPLDSETARKLEGTEGSRGGEWSPDSRAIVFGTDRELKRISLDNGDLVTLCELPGAGEQFPMGGVSWSPDGERIVFSSGLQLYEIATRGGEPKLLFEREPDGPQSFWSPHVLPSDGASKGLLYTFFEHERRVGLLDLNTGEHRDLAPGGGAVYSQSGHLIFTTSDRHGLRALPFSVETLTVTGEVFPIEEAGRRPNIARDGTLVYFDGGEGDVTLLWRDREGRRLETIGQAQEIIAQPNLSPDGRRVAMAADSPDGNRDLWVHDTVRGTNTRLTFDPAREGYPAWSPSGEQITFVRGDGRGSREELEIYSKPADGSGEAVPLVHASDGRRGGAPEWSPDGRFLIFQWQSEDTEEATQRDLWYVEPKAGGEGSEPVLYLRTEADEAIPVFSPDGRYVAYVSDESGRMEIYVRPFPEGGGKWQTSTNGGTQPRWPRDSKELFYVEGEKLMAVPVSTAQGFSQGTPKLLFRNRMLESPFPNHRYDVLADGSRVVLRDVVGGESDKPPAIRVVQNWYEEFRDREQD